MLFRTRTSLGLLLKLFRYGVALPIALNACSDGTAPSDAKLKSPQMPSLAVVYDNAINQADSYVAEDVSSVESATLEFSSPTYDPVVDDMVYSMELPTESESDHIEGGYGYDGSTLINMYNWGAEDYNSNIASAKIVNDAVTYLDAAGNVIPTLEPTLFTDVIATTTVNSIGSGPGGGGGRYCPEGSNDCCPPTADQCPGMNMLVGDGPSRPINVTRPTAVDTTDGVLVTIPIDEAGGRRGQLRKFYKKRDQQWVLLTEDEQTEQTLGSATLKSKIHRDHTKYVFHSNAEKDKARAEWKKNHTAARPIRASGGDPLARFTRPRITAPGVAQNARMSVPQARPDYFVDGGPGQGLVLVHGVISDETTWSRMEPWLTGDLSQYAFSRILVPSLNWRQPIRDQAADLEGRASVVGPNALFIGHSLGGLVSRRTGQANLVQQEPLVKGVVTIDSPHQGAIIAKALNFVDYQNLINNLRSSAFIKYCNKTAIACILDAAAAQSMVTDLSIAFSPSNGSAADLRPGSSSVQSFNSAYEPFIRGGIQNRIEGRFKWARLYGDKDHLPEEPWGGRWDQRLTSQFFLTMRHCHNAWWLGPGLTGPCGLVYSTILHLDQSFERHIDPSQAGSDGIVTVPSQNYPNTPSNSGAPRNFILLDGDSHVGALKTAAVRDGVLNQILPFYGLPHKPGR